MQENRPADVTSYLLCIRFLHVVQGTHKTLDIKYVECVGSRKATQRRWASCFRCCYGALGLRFSDTGTHIVTATLQAYISALSQIHAG